MKLLVAGATGVLGRAFLPHAKGHEIVGLTRSPAKLSDLARLGAQGLLCDVYEPGALLAVARSFRPELVINFLTDLAAGPGPANSRIRREGGPAVVAAAQACGAQGLVVESVSFVLSPDSRDAVTTLETSALGAGIPTWILRFGRFWGPGTWDATPPAAEAIHVDEAGRRAAEAIFGQPPGIYVLEG